MTKTTCYFRLDRVWNIHVETTENGISRFLVFNIFWGSNLPQETPRGSRLWRSQYFPLLRNIRISTNTPSQIPATRRVGKPTNIALEAPLAPLALTVFPTIKEYSYQHEHPFSNPSYAPALVNQPISRWKRQQDRLKTAAPLLFANESTIKHATWSDSCRLWYPVFELYVIQVFSFYFS